MKKQLNATGMVSELRGGSAFFKDRVPQRPIPDAQTSKTVRSYRRTTVRTDGQTVSQPTQRRTKRHPFEIYADQLKRLQSIKAKAMMGGETLSMSEMVREAIDQYLAKKE